MIPRELSNGYAISPGSTITVSEGEITDWSITINGEFPYTFASPEDRSDFVSFDGIVVTANAIHVQDLTGRGTAQTVTNFESKKQYE